MDRLYACVCVRVRVRVRVRSLRVVLAGTHLEKRETQAPRQQLPEHARPSQFTEGVTARENTPVALHDPPSSHAACGLPFGARWAHCVRVRVSLCVYLRLLWPRDHP